MPRIRRSSYIRRRLKDMGFLKITPEALDLLVNEMRDRRITRDELDEFIKCMAQALSSLAQESQKRIQDFKITRNVMREAIKMKPQHC